MIKLVNDSFFQSLQASKEGLFSPKPPRRAFSPRIQENIMLLRVILKSTGKKHHIEQALEGMTQMGRILFHPYKANGQVRRPDPEPEFRGGS